MKLLLTLKTMIRKKKGQYRFFYHYYKQYKCMSVHFKGVCYRTDNVKCDVPCETKWSKTQPNLVLQGWCNDIDILDNKIVIR